MTVAVLTAPHEDMTGISAWKVIIEFHHDGELVHKHGWFVSTEKQANDLRDASWQTLSNFGIRSQDEGCM